MHITLSFTVPESGVKPDVQCGPACKSHEDCQGHGTCRFSKDMCHMTCGGSNIWFLEINYTTYKIKFFVY